MKYLVLNLLLACLATNAMAQSQDSAGLSVSTRLIAAGWLRYWAGQPNVHTSVGEVSGYTSVEKKIRFYENSGFQINIYREDAPLITDPFLSPEPCMVRDNEEEVAVITGTWSVKNDSVYLSHKKEYIYNREKYLNHLYSKETNPLYKGHLQARGACKVNRREIYTFREDNLCRVGYAFTCYK